MDAKKTSASAAVVLAAALGGFATHAQLAPAQLPTSAQPVAMRWLKERAPKPPRYALGITGTVGAGAFASEIICEHDGSAPTRQAQPFPAAADLCKAAATFGNLAETSVPALAAQLAVPVPGQNNDLPPSKRFAANPPPAPTGTGPNRGPASKPAPRPAAPPTPAKTP